MWNNHTLLLMWKKNSASIISQNFFQIKTFKKWMKKVMVKNKEVGKRHGKYQYDINIIKISKL